MDRWVNRIYSKPNTHLVHASTRENPFLTG
jgi:hypothetical protein